MVAATFLAGQPSSAPGLKKLSSYDSQVKSLLSTMTLEEKIGQMTQPDQDFMKDPADIERLFLGSVFNGGDSDPAEGNSLKAWTDLYDRLQSHALKTRLRIPLLYGVDALHGHNNVLGAVLFPHNIGLGCARNPALVEKIARITAEEVRATGMNWSFAPCIAVPQDIRWGRTYEGFSEDPEIVGALGAAAVRGYQGQKWDDPLSVLASAKHFVGDGGTAHGTGLGGTGLDQGDMRLTEPAMRRLHLAPYRAAIAAGVGSIMVSYSSWNGEKISGNRYLLTKVLKEELGFEGIVVSDYSAIDQITPNYREAVERSINAGMDMVMVPTRYQEFVTDLKILVDEGKVPIPRIDDAVSRILRVKFAMGLMDPHRSPLADRKLHQSFGSAEHRAVARQAVRESLVLLKNDHGILPISKQAAHIYVGGRSADDMGNQSGGWTISWQGRSGEVTSGGTTILTAIRNAVSKSTQVTFNQNGIGADGANVGVVVIGETPYAEMGGDSNDLSLSPEDVRAVKTVKRAGIPVVVVLVSGRPMILTDILDSADAVVAAWLPGTEGAGVADVLFGDYKPSGKLSFTWPRSMAGLASRDGALFPLGYGLTW